MKRALPYVVALVIALVAFGAAVAVNVGIKSFASLPEGESVESVADAAVRPPVTDGAEVDAARTSRAPRGRSKKQYIDAILRRNIFDHEAINQEWGGSVSGDTEGTVTDLDVRLVGTIVAVPESFSSALIADDKKDAEAWGYSIGDPLMDAEVIGIERNKVTIRRANGSVELILMDDSDAPAERRSSSRGSGDDDEGIDEVGEDKYAVDRSLLDKYSTDLDALAGMGRARPHRGPDGEIDGYRLSAIRRGSLGEKLGIRNGDIVHSVNGQPLTSMAGAMGAYQALQSEAAFTFEITRRGQKKTLSYEVR